MENFLSDDPREQRDVSVLYFAALCVVGLFGYAGMKGFEQEREGVQIFLAWINDP
jgi:hypothetical protein